MAWSVTYRLKVARVFGEIAAAETRGDYPGALRLLDGLGPGWKFRAEDRALRALLLLRCQRLAEARAALVALRRELGGSDDPDRCYLWRWANATLALLGNRTRQFDFECPAFEPIYGLSREEAAKGDDYRSWLDMILPEDREGAGQAIARILAGEQVAFEYRITRPSDGRVCWLRETSFPIADAAGKVAAIGGIVHDVTELRESGQRSKLLLAELQHRVRNIMAMLRSVARRTADSADTVEDYVQHFEGRIRAMAATQALLTRDVHAHVDLQNLILGELTLQAARPAQFAVNGPDVALPPKAAEVLGLALHELATNSVKYGALGESEGRVDVRWALLEGEEAPQLSLIWSESGVAVERQPGRRGFGTELVTQRVPYELGGSGTMEFLPEGLVATLEFPLGDRDSILQTDEGVSR